MQTNQEKAPLKPSASLNEIAPDFPKQEDKAPQTNKVSPPVVSAESLVQEIINEGSAEAEFSAISSVLKHFRKQVQSNIPSSAFEAGGKYSPDAFRDIYRKKLSEELNYDELKELDSIGKTRVLRQYSQAEREMLHDPSLATAILYAREFKRHPPTPERLSLLKAIDNAAHLSALTFASLNILSKPLLQIAKKISQRPLNEKLVQKAMLIKLSICTKDYSEDDIRSLRDLLRSSVKQKELSLRHAAIVQTLQSFPR